MEDMKAELRSGIAIGVCSFLWLLLEFFLGFHSVRIDYQPFFNLISFTIPIIGIYWAMKAKRDRYYAGKISFIQALKTGLFITLVMSVISPILMFLYLTVVNPNYQATMLGHERLFIDGLNLSPEDKNSMLTNAIQNYSLLALLLKSFLISAISGGILSFLTAALMKRNNHAKEKSSDHSVSDYTKST